MKDGLHIKNSITIPAHELEITASRAGGPGGQHVNKTSSKITVRWNVQNTTALNDVQKQLVLEKLQAELTATGDIIVHNASSRSQQQNKKSAFDVLAQKIRQALYIPKKRIKSRTTKRAKENRLQSKKQRSEVKKLRSKKDYF